jgi:hypothetical protein
VIDKGRDGRGSGVVVATTAGAAGWVVINSEIMGAEAGS